MSIPKVTLGMPVYNGAQTVGAAIDSLIAQTFADWELVVGDNASTDATPQIVRDYAARDRRVRLLRHPANIGAPGNYSAVAREARGAYFKWASANDWCAPTLLERCVAALDEQPDAVLAYARTRLHEGSLDVAQDYDDGLDLRDERPSARFLKLLERMRLNNVMNGVIRTTALRKTRLLEPYFSSDCVMLGQLCLLGKFVEIPEYLFYRRMDPGSATVLRSRGEVEQFYYPNRERRLFQHWRINAAWLRTALAASIPFGEKLPILSQLVRRAYWERRDLMSDIGEAGQQLARRFAR
jgi:glycosyltransferase involved in cell wall biosynthesis